MIILARHGDAGAQAKTHFHGDTDESLSSKGRNEAYKLAGKLAQYAPSKIYHSPVQRAKETAQIVGSELGIPTEPADELKCLDLGNFIGKPNNDRNLEAIKHYLNNPNQQIPGGESVQDWANKYLPFLEDRLNEKGNQILLTHGRNILLSKGYIDKGELAPSFDKRALLDNDVTTDHGGYALIDKGNFKIVTPKATVHGKS